MSYVSKGIFLKIILEAFKELFSIFYVQTAVFMEKACSGWPPALPQRPWMKSSGTRSFPRCAGLLSKGKIREDLVDMLMKWRHLPIPIKSATCSEPFRPPVPKLIVQVVGAYSGAVILYCQNCSFWSIELRPKSIPS